MVLIKNNKITNCIQTGTKASDGARHEVGAVSSSQTVP